MRHLVTGGAGFIGSHLCEKLLFRGDEVICLDNLFTSRLDNVAHVRDYKGFEFVRHDVCQPFHFEVDRIWSLACPASPVHYQRNPTRTVKTSVLGTIHALELAREVGARVLLTSTSEVYGDPLEHPQREDYWGNVNPIGPRACYDEGKRCAETLCRSFGAQYGVDSRIVRLFNTYGPRMAIEDGRVISNFVVNALRGNALRVYAPGNQTRSFCYITDTVEALLRAMEAPPFVDPVNIGNPDEHTIDEIARMVRDHIHDTGIIILPGQVDDPKRRRPDITVAKMLLEWEPTVPLLTGLKRTARHFGHRLRGDGETLTVDDATIEAWGIA